MDSRNKSRRLFLFLEWGIDKDKKFENSGPNRLWVTNLYDYFFFLRVGY